MSSLQAQQKQFACTDDGDGDDDQPNTHTQAHKQAAHRHSAHPTTRRHTTGTDTHTGGTPFE